MQEYLGVASMASGIMKRMEWFFICTFEMEFILLKMS
jgi:hypothetical protein